MKACLPAPVLWLHRVAACCHVQLETSATSVSPESLAKLIEVENHGASLGHSEHELVRNVCKQSQVETLVMLIWGADFECDLGRMT